MHIADNVTPHVQEDRLPREVDANVSPVKHSAQGHVWIHSRMTRTVGNVVSHAQPDRYVQVVYVSAPREMLTVATPVSIFRPPIATVVGVGWLVRVDKVAPKVFVHAQQTNSNVQTHASIQTQTTTTAVNATKAVQKANVNRTYAQQTNSAPLTIAHSPVIPTLPVPTDSHVARVKHVTVGKRCSTQRAA